MQIRIRKLEVQVARPEQQAAAQAVAKAFERALEKRATSAAKEKARG